jgi:hypothetical protein
MSVKITYLIIVIEKRCVIVAGLYLFLFISHNLYLTVYVAVLRKYYWCLDCLLRKDYWQTKAYSIRPIQAYCSPLDPFRACVIQLDVLQTM